MYSPLSRRRGASALMPLIIVALLILVIFAVVRWRTAESRLKQLSVQLEQLQGNPQQNQEKAQEIVTRVRKLMDIPAEVEPTVAAIVDVEKLREQNQFYAKAENGDFLIVTPTRAILFDPDTDRILDVVPVQIEPNAAEGAAVSAGSSVGPEDTSAGN
jgi:hypothetical protein